MIYLLQKINYLKLFWNVILVIQTEKKIVFFPWSQIWAVLSAR